MQFIFGITYFNLAVLIRHINKCKNSVKFIQGTVLHMLLRENIRSVRNMSAKSAYISLHNEILWETTHL